MDEVLKQRLIGAAVLIALAVIFVPMFFGGDNDDALPPATLDPAMPTSPMAEREVRRLPLNPNRSVATEAQPVAAPVELPPAAQTQSAEETPTERVPLRPVDNAVAPEPSETSPAESLAEPKPDEVSRSVPMTSAEPAPQTTPASVVAEASVAEPSSGSVTDGSGWQVQVASFSAEATAKGVADALREQGHSVSIDRLVRGQSVLYRVSTGPYANRAQAETARSAIEKSTAGVSPVVRAPIENAQAVAGIEPGYAVQVGSFTSDENAKRLESRLRSQGFSVFSVVEEVGGRSIWRVRVGTVDSREAADALQARLKQEVNLEGLVVSHP